MRPSGAQSRWVDALAACVLLGAAGCGGGGLAPLEPVTPTVDSGQAKCKVAASQENPLVTEWPASEKANLEARLRSGAVVVAYAGCTLRMLAECQAPGAYQWRRTTTATEQVEIRTADELYAKLPLGAVGLEGELERSGRIAVETTVAGQLELSAFDESPLAKNPACEGATHVVGALSVGAFKMRSGGAVSAQGGVSAAGVSAGGGTERSESVMREAGSPERCRESSEQAPHVDCASPVQLFLRPLSGRLVDRGPPGTVKVTAASADGARTWTLGVGDRKICETPCTRWLDPNIPYTLTTEAGWLRPDHVAEFPDLRPLAGAGPLHVRAHTMKGGRLALGVVGASLGGIGLMAGTLMTALGCRSNIDTGEAESSGACIAGIITLPVSAGLIGGGVYFIVDSGPWAEVSGPGVPREAGWRRSPWQPRAAGARPRTVGLGGTF